MKRLSNCVRQSLLAGPEGFAELQEACVVGSPIIKHIPDRLDDTEAIQALGLQNSWMLQSAD